MTTTGAMQLWQHDPLQWHREEGLADIRVVEFVELPERKPVGTHLEESEGFAPRVRWQLTKGRDFPSYGAHFVKRFVTGSYESVSAPIATPVNETDCLVAAA